MVEAVDVQSKAETNRDRVRRVLMQPLGFRFKAGTPEDVQAKALNAICDDVGYLDDQQLVQLRGVVQTKGEGSAKAFWPSVATFRGYAEAIAPRPLEELPALVSWLGSREGDAARADGSLVALWAWFEAKKIPPYKPEHRQQVAKRSSEYARRLEVIEDRRGRRVFDPQRFPRDARDAAFERWYVATDLRARRVIASTRGGAVELEEGAKA